MIQLFWNVAAKQIAAFREIHRAFGPSHACGDLLERAAVEPVLGEARIEDFNGRVGIPLVRPGSEGLRAGFLRNGYGCYACADALRFALVCSSFNNGHAANYCGSSEMCRFCCKSRKLHRSEFVVNSSNATRPTIRTPSVALSRSPVNLACGDEVPQIHTRKTRLWPLEF